MRDRSAIGKTAATAREQYKASAQTIGKTPSAPSRIKIFLRREELHRGWKTVEIGPPLLMYGVGFEEIQKGITEFLERLVASDRKA